MANKGKSEQGLFGTINHYDEKGRKTGHSDPGLFGGYTNYDKNGKKVSHSDPGLFGSYNHNTNQGCYIASCVYGSYDCPQVWTLRRFRDNFLAKNIFGKIFIHIYYAVSPTLVKAFGERSWFKKTWYAFLNPFVKFLNRNGIKDTPYKDKSYK